MKFDPNISRRDILKLMALTPAAFLVRPILSRLGDQANAETPHVLIFVFDAWTAYDVQLFGYPRKTMPNIERFAQRALVYHNHYSTGNFTVPGTASLLTSLYPWNHRAFQLSSGGIAPQHVNENIFTALSSVRSTAGYSQNPFADIFLYQFRDHLDTYISNEAFNLESRLISSLPIFDNDAQIASASLDNNILRNGKGSNASLFMGLLFRLGLLRRYSILRKNNLKAYPKGPPVAGGVFLLEDLVDGIRDTIKKFDSPTLAYFHAFPPHEPYSPKREFLGLFHDGWTPPQKPIHPLSRKHAWEETIASRLRYDQYLATWDAEFGRMLNYLETSGLMDKSIVIITSDHGEMFERGEIEHNTPLLYRPVVQVPLLISLPGQNARKDVNAFTSSLDILPTISHLLGVAPPPWSEGRPLPGLGGTEDPNRSIYSMEAKSSSSFGAINRMTIGMIKQGFRLIYYQYASYTGFEFYDMLNDPEELKDLFPSAPKLALQMKDELLQTIADFNRPYLRS